MKDVTFGVKVPEDLRDRINELMKESGLVGREFMEQLIDSYMLEHYKDDIPEMAEDIRELEQLTHRINQIYLHIGARFKNTLKGYKDQVEEVNLENQSKLDTFNNQISDYKTRLEDNQNKLNQLEKTISDLESEKGELENELLKLKEYNSNYKELNNEYKNKIEVLSSDIEKFKGFKKENQELVKSNDNLASDLWFSKREVEKLNDYINKSSDEFQKEKKRLIDQFNLEKQTLLLEVKLKHQEEVEALNEKIYNMQKNYNEKVKDLLLELENTKNIKTNSKIDN